MAVASRALSSVRRLRHWGRRRRQAAALELVIQRLFGPMFDPRIRLEDQNGAIATSTFAGIAEFMETYELDQEVFELTSPYAAAGDAS